LKHRFRREAQAIAALNGPHICTLYDIGAQDGIDYLVMEYLEGETLKKRIERGPLSTAAALDFAVQYWRILSSSAVGYRDTFEDAVLLSGGLPNHLLPPFTNDHLCATHNRDSPARCHPKNSRLARSAFPPATSGPRRRCRHDPVPMGLKTGVPQNSARRIRVPSVPPFRRSNLLSGRFSGSPASNFAKLAQKNRILGWLTPLISLMLRLVQLDSLSGEGYVCSAGSIRWKMARLRKPAMTV
jgi:hypothetical protein